MITKIHIPITSSRIHGFTLLTCHIGSRPQMPQHAGELADSDLGPALRELFAGYGAGTQMGRHPGWLVD